MSFGKRELSLFTVALSILLGGPAYSGTTGKISGTVIDRDTRDALPGVNVIVLKNGMETGLGAMTDINGKYFILRIPPGEYSVTASMMGYRKMIKTSVRVAVDLTTTLDFSLIPTILDVGAEVIVTAERPIILKDVTASSHRFMAEEIKNMPAVTGVRDILALQPGVVGHGQHINIRGGRTGEVLLMVDGMSIRDPIWSQASRTTQEQVIDINSNPVDELSSSTGGLGIPSSAIQEIEVITGGFNAEYGKAMSGMVNVVTKEGGRKPSGRILYMTDRFGYGNFGTPFEPGTGLNAYSFNSDKLELSVGGPEPISSYLLPRLGVTLPGQDITYFYSATANFTDLSSAFDIPYYCPNGERRYDALPYGRLYMTESAPIPNASQRAPGINLSPFNSPIPWYRRWFLMGLNAGNRMDNKLTTLLNLTYRLSSNHKIKFSHQTSDRWYDEYNHTFRLTPETFWQRTEIDWKTSLTWDHVLSDKTFYTLQLGYYETNFLLTPGGMLPPEVYQLYLDLGERTYLDNDHDRFYEQGFPARGTYHRRQTKKWTGKLDWTSQFHRSHLIKSGLELSYYEMRMNEIKYPYYYYPEHLEEPEEWWGEWPEFGVFRDFYLRTPTAGALYLQDKIEYETLILNLGLRFDFWVPGKQVDEKVEQGTKVPGFKLKYKSTLSPRLGVSHPITDKDVLYFQFGKFTQEVDYTHIFMQSTQTGSAYKLYGNPNLNAQESTQYEVGVKHAFSDFLKLQLTGFFKDYKGLVNAERRGEYPLEYSIFVNRDYGSARGFELALTKRYSKFTSGKVSYTYSYASGKSSSYRQGYDYSYQGRPIPIREWPLDWDVRHAANMNFDFRVPKGSHLQVFGLHLPDSWGVNVLWRFQTGYPYTPSGRAATQFTTTNSGRYPNRMWLDLRFNKDFYLWGLQYSILMDINNVLNRRNARAIDPETGDAYGVLDELDRNPAKWASGRNIQLGLAIEW